MALKVITYKIKVKGFTGETPYTNFTPVQFAKLIIDDVNNIAYEKGGRQFDLTTLVTDISDPA